MTNSTENGPVDAGLPARWPPAVTAALAGLQQGHLVAIDRLFYRANVDHAVWAASRALAAQGAAGPTSVTVPAQFTPDLAIVTSQTCDLAEKDPAEQPWVQVAPVYAVPKASPIVSRAYIRKLRPPDLPTQKVLEAGTPARDVAWVADLRLEIAYEKSYFVGCTPLEAFASEKGYIEFAKALARRRGRPALGNVVFEAVNGVIKDMRADEELRPCCNAAKRRTMKLTVMVTEGSRLLPKAFVLYLVTKDPLGGHEDAAEVERFKEQWWDRADRVCQAHGVKLMRPEVRDGRSIDLHEYDRLVEIHNPL